MKIGIDRIRNGRYRNIRTKQEIIISCAEIKKALVEGYIENRSMQAFEKELKLEWKNVSIEESIRLQKKYHVDRIATLSRSSLNPIIICKHSKSEDSLIDGGHRVWAARCLGEFEIEAIEVDLGKPFDRKDKIKICNEIAKYNGDSETALIHIGYKYKI